MSKNEQKREALLALVEEWRQSGEPQAHFAANHQIFFAKFQTRVGKSLNPVSSKLNTKRNCLDCSSQDYFNLGSYFSADGVLIAQKMKISLAVLVLIGLTSFSCTSEVSEELPDNFKKQRELFFSSLDLFAESVSLSVEMPNYPIKDQDSVEQRMYMNIEQAVNKSHEVSDNFLEYLHPNLPYYYREKLVKGSVLFKDGYSGLSENNSISILKQIQSVQLISDWHTFLGKNGEDIDSKLYPTSKSSTFNKISKALFSTPSKLSYWRMFLRFLLSTFVFIIAFGFVFLAVLSPLVPIKFIADKTHDRLFTILSIPIFIFSGILQAYLWVLWAAYCAFTIQLYMSNPTVDHYWLYYVTGFFMAASPIGFLNHKEMQLAQSYQEVKSKKMGTNMYSLIVIGAFISFCIWDELFEIIQLNWLNSFLYQ